MPTTWLCSLLYSWIVHIVCLFPPAFPHHRFSLPMSRRPAASVSSVPTMHTKSFQKGPPTPRDIPKTRCRATRCHRRCGTHLDDYRLHHLSNICAASRHNLDVSIRLRSRYNRSPLSGHLPGPLEGTGVWEPRTQPRRFLLLFLWIPTISSFRICLSSFISRIATPFYPFHTAP